MSSYRLRIPHTGWLTLLTETEETGELQKERRREKRHTDKEGFESLQHISMSWGIKARLWWESLIGVLLCKLHS